MQGKVFVYIDKNNINYKIKVTLFINTEEKINKANFTVLQKKIKKNKNLLFLSFENVNKPNVANGS